MLVVGLTGGIGSGKSLAASYFEQLGAQRIDMDEIARGLVTRGHSAYSPECIEQIVLQFGPQVVDDNGTLRREVMREIVFADTDKRKQLETLLHPKIREHVKARLQQLHPSVCIVEIPLLVSRDQFDFLDRILVIEAENDTRCERIQARDRLNKSQINAIMDAQLDSDKRLALADDVINNNGSIEELKAQVDALYQQYVKTSNKH